MRVGTGTPENRQKYLKRRNKKLQYNKEYYKKNRDIILEKSRKYREKKKILVLSHYSKELKCACCGENHIEFLSIDHISGGGTKHRRKIGGKGGFHFYLWLEYNNYPDGYRVLCYNCNCSQAHVGHCPHEKEAS